MMKKLYYLLRALQIVGLFIVVGVIIYQFSMLTTTSNEIKYQQTQKFAASLSHLAAAESTRYLIKKQDKELALLINNLGHDPIVRDATIYDNLGQILYQSEGVLPLENILQINQDDAVPISGVVPYVSELYDGDKKIGYIRITLEQKKILNLIKDYQDKSMSTMGLLLMLSFLAGLILMALFFRRLETAYYYFSKAICRLYIKMKSFSGHYTK
ncbi:AhpA/YtjB family protein [Psychromonas sp. PT13]|uniref:AhpA/YtjB family protein n=1 Tax=Psychromonas sp. PT13 TaxID=3439547 RepID=UPI003EBBE598